MNLKDNIFLNPLMKKLLADMPEKSRVIAEKRISEMIGPLEEIASSINELCSTKEGKEELSKAFEYLISEEKGIKEWQEKH
jgi:hypothetical protein